MKPAVLFSIIIAIVFIALVFMLFKNFWPEGEEQVENNVVLLSAELRFFPSNERFFYELSGNHTNQTYVGVKQPNVREFLEVESGVYDLRVHALGYYEKRQTCTFNVSGLFCDVVVEPVGSVTMAYGSQSKALRMIVNGTVRHGLLCVGYRDFVSFKINLTKSLPPRAYQGDYDFCKEFENLESGVYDYVIGGVQSNGAFWTRFDYLRTGESSEINSFKY